MGVYIPNMEKPKSCWECRLMDGEANCLVTDEGIPFEQEGILPDCPLIEIDDEAIDIAQDIIDGCKRFKERRTDE